MVFLEFKGLRVLGCALQSLAKGLTVLSGFNGESLKQRGLFRSKRPPDKNTPESLDIQRRLDV